MTQLTIMPHPPGGHPGLPGSSEVHLWCTNLDDSPGDISVLSHVLSPQEQSRARRFAFEKHRRRFIVAKAWSRSVLGPYLKREPCDVPLTADARGKPHIIAEANHVDLRFSLTHCGRFAMLAVTINQNIGVDGQDPIPDESGPADLRFSGKQRPDELPGAPHTLIVARNVLDLNEVRYFLSNRLVDGQPNG